MKTKAKFSIRPQVDAIVRHSDDAIEILGPVSGAPVAFADSREAAAEIIETLGEVPTPASFLPHHEQGNRRWDVCRTYTASLAGQDRRDDRPLTH